tara:strand:+ start:102 stop:545 length:444 start_codon:yes stop_codon:yes gene_type:complete
MRTNKQLLGDFGENLIIKKFNCPKCKRIKSLKKLPQNFKCADIICDFCGYLAQVKTKTVSDIEKFPSKVLGAAWGPQKERMDAGIYFPLFVVLKNGRNHSVFYLSSDLQTEVMFIKRKPLSKNAKRAGWQGFYFDGELMKKFISRLL